MSLEAFYGDWRRYDELVVRALQVMSAEDLALRATLGDAASSTHWPIWAIAGHTAGTRVFWLCDVMGEPGAETTPFTDAYNGWEDDLDHPRSGAELARAFRSTWAIVEGALERWTPASLDEVVVRHRPDGRDDRFTRRSLLLRMITHEAYHVGEIALIQGLHGRPEIDLWPSGWHTVDAEVLPHR